MKSINGLEWETIETEIEAFFCSSYFVDGNYYLLGSGGVMLKSSDTQQENPWSPGNRQGPSNIIQLYQNLLVS